ncbi:MAG: hypothetical protein HKO82_08845, partial [Acidimicrobiia bacterium]|nr:hypothetical protein [Acidimicrobiia bacterium]
MNRLRATAWFDGGSRNRIWALLGAYALVALTVVSGTSKQQALAATWATQSTPTTEHLEDVDFPVNDQTGWAVGTNATVLHTSDGGTVWSAQSVPTAQDLFGVDFVDNLTGWAVGSNGTVLKSTDGGGSWVAQTSPLSVLLNSVHFPADASTGYAVGGNGTILKTTDGGTNWVAQSTPTTSELTRVYFPLDATTGYVVAQGGTILKTANGGSTWVSQPNPTGQNLTGVHFPVDTATGWVSGRGPTILRTIDGGANWTSQTSPVAEQLNDLYMFDTLNGVIVGNNGTILETTDGGANWTSDGPVTGDHLNSVHWPTASTGFAVGNTGTIVRATGDVSVSGTIFEDIAGDALSAGSIGDAANPAAAGVTVHLYRDDGDGVPDAADTSLGSDITDASGAYSFSALDAGESYWVVADSSTVPAAGGYNSIYGAADAVPEQTYGPAGSLCANPAAWSTTTSSGATGPCYGGREVSTAGTSGSDNLGTWYSGSEHLALIDLSSGSISNADFGFSFNVVVGRNSGVGGSAEQGSFDRFLQNANAIAGANPMHFVPSGPTNAAAVGADWWLLAPSGALTPINDADTAVDGTAFNNTGAVRNDNPGAVGTGGTVGVDAIALAQVAGSELQIDGQGLVVADDGVAGLVPHRATIRALSITEAGAQAIRVNAIDQATPVAEDIVLEDLIIGMPPVWQPQTLPTGTSAGIHLNATNRAVLRDSFIGWTNGRTLNVETSTNATITGSEFRDTSEDVIDIYESSSGTLFEGNRVSGGLNWAIDITVSSNTTLRNNTIDSAGDGIGQTGGVRLYGPGSTIDRNIFSNNAGPAIAIAGTMTSPARPVGEAVITGNHFVNNDGLSIDLQPASDDNLLSGDGITPNDGGGLDATHGNRELDFPVISGANLSGATTTVTGTACSGCTVEIYRAVGGTGDDDPPGSGTNYHGEGVAFLGSGVATGGAFSIDVTGLADGEAVSATATDTGPGVTSEFALNETVVGLVAEVSGTVFEDIAGDVLAGAQTIGDVSNPGVPGVAVTLWKDNASVGLADAGDTIHVQGGLTNPATTDANGDYSFANLPGGDYYVVVDSRTIAPTAGLRSGHTVDETWAEQTWAPEYGYARFGPTSKSWSNWAKPFYGGANDQGQWYAESDDASDVETAEHFSGVTLAAGEVRTGVDFGFSFNVVTNVLGGDSADHDMGAARTVQGSLRQFLQNANAIAGSNAMRFVPVLPPNDTSWWEVLVTDALPAIDDEYTNIDGTAYDDVDGVAVLDTNPGYLGSNAAGGLTVGTDGLALEQIERPELEIQGDQTAALPPQLGLEILASHTTVRDLALLGFGDTLTAGLDSDIRVGPSVAPLEGIVLDRLVIGSAPDTFADPGVGTRSQGTGIRVSDAVSGGGLLDNVITDNLVGFVRSTGVLVNNDTGGWIVSGNEIRNAGTVPFSGRPDGLSVEGGGSTSHAIIGNLIAGSSRVGVETWRSDGGHSIVNNDILASSVGVADETAGVRLAGTGNLVEKNRISGGDGPGIIVIGENTASPHTASVDNRISQNEFGTNTGLAIDLVAATTVGASHSTGDGLTLTPGTDPGTGNNGLDAPAISSATSASVSGTACASCRVELYRAVSGVGDGGYGEGVEYLGFATADGAGDWTLSGVTGALLGQDVAALAIDGSNDTSEFGANVTVVPARTITGTVFEDVVGDALAVGALADADNPAVPGVTVSLYRDGGDGVPDGGDDGAPIATTATNASGQFTFGSLPSDLYWVTIDSLGVAPSAGLQNPTPQAGLITVTGTDDTWAEQTYGPVGAVAESGASYTYAPGAGPFYGGKTPTGADGPGLGGSEHIARVDFPGGATGTDIDFGFSFQVVTNLEAGDSTDVGVDDRVYQGSFRQFQRNAGAIIGRNDMRFVPVVPTNGTNGVDTWWILDVSDRLMLNYDAFTILDGTAYDAGNPLLVLDTNTASVGTGNGTGVLGAITTPTLNPELELRGDGVVQTGLSMDPGAHNSVIRNFAVTGFPTYGIIVTGPAATPIDNALVERNVFGTAAGAMADSPATKLGNFGISLQQTTNSQASNNVIAYVGGTGIRTISSADAWIHRNEILQADVYGIYTSEAFGTDAGRQTISNNDIVASGYTGVSLNDSWGGHTITSNTISGSGRLTSVNEVGIRVGPSNNLIVLNRIAGNGGSGVTVAGGATPSIGNEITQNRFGGNGLIAIDLIPSGGSSWAGEGITPNDGATNPTSGNLELDFPVIDFVDAATGTVSGTACAACDVELYVAVADGDASDDDGSGRGHGEGITFLVRIPQDGSPAWSTTGLSFLTSDAISAIAIDGGGNTSEFSRNAATNVAPTLDPVGDQSTDELVNLSFAATASDTNAGDTLTFSLSGEPVGASITAGGVFSWTPTEAQGPGSYSFDVVVSDDGNPALSDSETITVTVGEVNLAPVLDPVGDRSVDELASLSFTATASDPDDPANTLVFSLAGAPAGASITAGGVFSWTPTEAQGPGSYSFDVVVTETNGLPTNLSDSETITVTVGEVNL